MVKCSLFFLALVLCLAYVTPAPTSQESQEEEGHSKQSIELAPEESAEEVDNSRKTKRGILGPGYGFGFGHHPQHYPYGLYGGYHGGFYPYYSLGLHHGYGQGYGFW